MYNQVEGRNSYIIWQRSNKVCPAGKKLQKVYTRTLAKSDDRVNMEIQDILTLPTPKVREATEKYYLPNGLKSKNGVLPFIKDNLEKYTKEPSKQNTKEDKVVEDEWTM